MKTKPLTFLLALTFLFLFCGSVFGNISQDALDAYKRKDYKEAVRLYRLAAEQGEAIGQYNMGLMYFQGKGVPQDYKEAVKWNRLAAEQGYANAQNFLGVMYFHGKGVPKDIKETARLLRLAVEQGHAEAQHLLSLLYENGTGVPQDFKEAVRLLRLSAEQGFAEAQFKLGYMYHQGDGVPRDQKEALKWYRRAEKQGHKLAKASIEYIENNLKKEDPPSASFLPPSLMDTINKDPFLKKAWEETEEVSPAEDAYMNGDSKKTFKILKPLAEKGNSHAQYTFARMYEVGFFKDIGNKSTNDIREAVKWYELAAEQESLEALYNLGSLYYHGNKTPKLRKNYVRAAGYFRRAVDAGDEVSMYMLGKMHYEGKGVIQDYVQAHKWLNISNAKGIKQAINLRDIVEKKMTKDQIAEAQELARNWKPKK